MIMTIGDRLLLLWQEYMRFIQYVWSLRGHSHKSYYPYINRYEIIRQSKTYSYAMYEGSAFFLKDAISKAEFLAKYYHQDIFSITKKGIVRKDKTIYTCSSQGRSNAETP